MTIRRAQTVGRTTLWLLLVLCFVSSKAYCEDLEEIPGIKNVISENSVDESNKSIDFSPQTNVKEPEKDQPENSSDTLGMDSLTIIWYLTTFTALLGFFVVMACTENSCGRARNSKPDEIVRTCPPTPCPSYKNFAPPSYDTVMKKYRNPQVFIVPVHENSILSNQTMNCSSGQSQAATTCIEIEKRSEISIR